MSISYFGSQENCISNHTRSKKLKDGHLVTTDYGSWAYLTSEEYRKFRNNDVQEPLLSLLKNKGIMIDTENIANVIKNYRKKCIYLFQGTSLHIVVPTLRCNLKCAYCHSKSKPENSSGYDMNEEVAKKTIDFIFQTPSKAVTIEFQGGEPLLNFKIIKYIIDYAKKLNAEHEKELRFDLVTNLTIMNDEILEFLIKEKIGLCTSLDGCKEVHDKNRQQYDKTVSWIKKIKEHYNIRVMPLVTKHSLPYYKEIVDEYVNLGLNTIWLKPLNNLGYARKNWEEIGISAEEFLTFWKKTLDYIVKLNKKIPLRENSTTIILRKILKKEGDNFTDLQSPCGAAISQLAYNYDGGIYTCDEGRLFDIFKLGTVEDKYKDVLSSKEALSIVKSSMNDNPSCEICAYKPYCGLCPVCSYSETNNIITKIPDRRCDILKGMFDYIFEKLLFDKEYRQVFFGWLEEERIPAGL